MSERLLRSQTGQQLLIGLGIAGVGVAIAVGACFIPGAAGYAGVGPNFLPWLVACVLIMCGSLLAWQARHGGWREVEAPSGAAQGDWRAFAWVGAAVLANAALITTLGFVLSCALCFAMAVRGLRQSEGRPAGSWQRALADLATGLAISAPVFWLFRGLLAINLPSLLPQGWL